MLWSNLILYFIEKESNSEFTINSSQIEVTNNTHVDLILDKSNTTNQTMNLTLPIETDDNSTHKRIVEDDSVDWTNDENKQ